MKEHYQQFSSEELTREYSPSSCIDDIDVYLKQYKSSSAAIRAKIAPPNRALLDLEYGGRPLNTLDIFLPAPGKQLPPLHLFIHGGYWQALDKADSCFMAENFIEHKAGLAVVNYTLAPDANIDQIVAEIAQAIVWLYKNAGNYGFDSNRIYLSGSSAGAHLAAMMLHQDWTRRGLPAQAIKGALLISGIFDLEPIAHTYVNEPLSLTAEQISRNSPLYLPTPSQTPSPIPSLSTIPSKRLMRCPVIIAYGDNETNEFKRQSNDYYELLTNRGFDCHRHEIKGRNHFDVVLDLAEKQSTLSRLALQQMGLASPVSDAKPLT